MAKKKDFTNPTELFLSTPQEISEPAEMMAADPESFTVPEGYRLIRESKSKRLQLLVTPTIAANMKAAAMIEGISLNELCNRIFEDYLRKDLE